MLRYRHHAVAALILIAGLTGSLYSASRLLSLTHSEARERFDSAVIDTYGVISMRIASYEDVLRGVQSLFAASSGQMTAEVFTSYIRNMDLPRRYPGFNAFNYAVLTRNESELADVVREARTRYQDYTIKRKGPGPLHQPIIYMEPVIPTSIGTDTLLDAAGIHAMTTMVASGDITTSGRMVEVRRGTERLNVLPLRIPVYRHGMPTATADQRRAAYLGSTGTGLDLERMLGGPMDRGPAARINFTIYSAQTDNTAKEIYRNDGTSGHIGKRFEARRDFVLGGHDFRMLFDSPADAWVDATQERLTLIMVILGVLVSMLTARVVYKLMDSGLAMQSQLDISQEKLWSLAMFDPLTGLPNRNLLTDRLVTAIEHAKRERVSLFIFFVDLDRFKHVNDTYGHHAGDQLLKEVAERLTRCVRSSDTVGRLGGDEFIVIATDADGVDPSVIAVKIVAALKHPFAINGHSLMIGASVGICSYPDDGADASALLRHADIAMYRTKRAGGDGFHYFSNTLDTEASDRMAIEEDLSASLRDDGGGLELYFQPKIDVASGHVCGAEALIRWNHPTRGLMPPSAFISIAEDCGLIIELGAWIARTADASIAQWAPLNITIPIAINVSLKQISSDARLNDFITVLNGLQYKSMIDIEITESIAFADKVHVDALIERAHLHHMKVALDDFGTGFSSLTQLRLLDVDALKIDQQFIGGFLSERKDRAIVGALIKLTHELGMTAIAEGVETMEQMDQLYLDGCDVVQGYYISKPLRAADFIDFVAERGCVECDSRHAVVTTGPALSIP